MIDRIVVSDGRKVSHFAAVTMAHFSTVTDNRPRAEVITLMGSSRRLNTPRPTRCTRERKIRLNNQRQTGSLVEHGRQLCASASPCLPWKETGAECWFSSERLDIPFTVVQIALDEYDAAPRKRNRQASCLDLRG
jgi:hypothetical protein